MPPRVPCRGASAIRLRAQADRSHAPRVASFREYGDSRGMGTGLLDRGAPRLYAVVLTLKCQSQHAELESRHEPGNNQSATPSHPLLLLR